MRKYRIKEHYYIFCCCYYFYFDVQVKTFWGWKSVKKFRDKDYKYAKLCAQELLDKLNEEI